MLVAVVSSCPTFSSALFRRIQDNHPSVHVSFFQNLQELMRSKGNLYSLVFIKLFDIDISRNMASELAQSFSEAQFVALRSADTRKANFFGYPLFAHAIAEPDLVSKLFALFQKIFPALERTNPLNSNPCISKNAEVYVNLKPELQTCLFMLYKKESAVAIGEKLGKSERTVQGLVAQLKKKFGVDTIVDLQKLYFDLRQEQKDLDAA